MEHFYQRLKFHRDKRGIKVAQMGKLLGVSVSTYRDWEYGRSITGEPYVLMSQVLQISLSELLTGNKASPIKIRQSLEKIKKHVTELELNSFF
jgi:transcriptional regulator with XRE-family HTH domain